METTTTARPPRTAVAHASMNVEALKTPWGLPPLPWRDPHTVSPVELKGYIQALEDECLDHPRSAELRVCLGMAYAMSYDVHKSMDALEVARELEPENFFAQMKYSELLYRLRILIRAEAETIRAANLAMNPWELSVARKQLLEIRRLMREGTQKPTWDKPLTAPALMLLSLFAVIFLVMYLK
ncbi:MAG TPA: hypothetical protein VK210_12460 [Terriglobia bacterium]|nr:hypothetical protein [Terriglobia bacterium]